MVTQRAVKPRPSGRGYKARWIRGESKIGLTKSIFISLKNYTNVTQDMLVFFLKMLGHSCSDTGFDGILVKPKIGLYEVFRYLR